MPIPQVVVHKGRTVKIVVSLGRDVSNATIVSEIREQLDRTSQLIATWTPSFLTDGVDGDVVLELDDAITGPIVQDNGWMDVKIIEGGEPIPAFDDPVEVLFRETVTV